MTVSRATQPRWVIQHIDEQTVRCAKELALRHDVRIADIVETAIYQLYANPDRLNGWRPRSERADDQA